MGETPGDTVKTLVRGVLGAWLLLAVLTGWGADSASKWLISRPAVYAENHDPGMIWLRDGSKLEVRFTEIPWEVVNTWKPGRPLAIAYSSATGPVLVDVQTGRALPVVSGWKTHPLDEYLAGRPGKEGSTLEMVEALSHEHQLWRKEMERAYASLRRRLDEKQKEKLVEAQARWEHWARTEIELIGALDDENAGTIGRVIAGGRVVRLVRERALALVGY